MGCGCSAASAAQEPRPRAQSSNGAEIVPGQCAIIRNCPNARLNGERVVCEEYNAGLGEWMVKGDKFPLSVGMSLGAQFLEVTETAPTLLGNNSSAQGKDHTCPMLVPGQCAIIHNCPNARLNGQQVVCEEYNAALGEWTVKGDKFPLSVGMSLGAQFLEVVKPCANNGIVEFTDTDGDKVLLKRSGDLGIDLYVNDKVVVRKLINLEVRDHTIHVEGAAAGNWGAATVPSGQEYILKQALDLFAEKAL